jgi:hypothetical protein
VNVISKTLLQEISYVIDFLRTTRVGTTMHLAGGAFTKIRADKNHVFLLHHKSKRFYLKVPAQNRSVSGPARGAEILASMRDQTGDFLIPEVFIVDPTGFEVVSELQGSQLKQCLYGKAFVFGWPYLKATFKNIGKLSRILHDSRQAPEESDRDLLQMCAALDTRRRHIKHSLEKIGHGNYGFLHGNLSVENIIVDCGRVGFIDFENAGLGLVLTDISLLMRHLFLMEIAASPWHLMTKRAIPALLEGYSLDSKSSTMLAHFVYLWMELYYAERFRDAVPSLNRVAGCRVLHEEIRRFLDAGPEMIRDRLSC